MQSQTKQQDPIKIELVKEGALGKVLLLGVMLLLLVLFPSVTGLAVLNKASQPASVVVLDLAKERAAWTANPMQIDEVYLAILSMQGIVNGASSNKVYLVNGPNGWSDSGGGFTGTYDYDQWSLDQGLVPVPQATAALDNSKAYPVLSYLVRNYQEYILGKVLIPSYSATRGTIQYTNGVAANAYSIPYNPLRYIDNAVAAAATCAGRTSYMIASPLVETYVNGEGLSALPTIDCRNLTNQLEAFNWAYSNYFTSGVNNDSCMRFLRDSANHPEFLNSLDYFIATRAFVTSADAYFQNPSFVSLMSHYAPGSVTFCNYEWTPEYMAVQSQGYANVIIAGCNLSVFSGFPSGTDLGNAATPSPTADPSLDPRNAYIAFYVTDGDSFFFSNYNHILSMLGGTYKGSTPIGWSVNPYLVDLKPTLINWYTHNNYTNRYEYIADPLDAAAPQTYDGAVNFGNHMAQLMSPSASGGNTFNSLHLFWTSANDHLAMTVSVPYYCFMGYGGGVGTGGWNGQYTNSGATLESDMYGATQDQATIAEIEQTIINALSTWNVDSTVFMLVCVGDGGKDDDISGIVEKVTSDLQASTWNDPVHNAKGRNLTFIRPCDVAATYRYHFPFSGSTVTGIVQFASGSYSVAESGGTVAITVSRQNGASGAVTVDFATGDGTGTASVNYVATNGTLSFGSGETSKTFTVTILDDGIAEPNRTVNITLSHLTGTAVFGSPATAVLTIIDDDGPGSFQFSRPSYGVAQGAGTMSIQVVRADGKTGAVTVNYATSDGTGVAGVNYAPASGTLSFATGETSKTFSVTILNQPVGASGQTVNLALSSPTGGATLGSPATAVLTIAPPEPFSLWSYNMKIRFPGYTSTEALTNFPVLLVFSNNMGGGFDYRQVVSPSGGDLRFTDSTKTNILNHEIEQWSTNGASYVWVQAPTLTSNCQIWAYWGNSATNPPAYTTQGATWSADFKGVWHLGETSGSTHYDSTTNGNHFPANGTASMGIAGAVDGAAGYNGSGHGSISSPNSSLNLTDKVLTVGIWIYPKSQLDQMVKAGFLGRLQEAGGADGDYGLIFDWNTVRFFGANVNFATAYEPPINGWTYLVGVCDGALSRFYVNGVQVASIAASGNTPTRYPVLLAGGAWGNSFNGNLDEGRVMAAGVSSNWVWTSYINMASNSTFCSYEAGGNPPVITNAAAAKGTPIAWLDSYGLNGDYDAQELADQDHDGMLTWQEYLAGSDPTNSNSRLALTSLQTTPSGVRVGWQGGTDVWQYLESRFDLLSTVEQWTAVFSNAPPTPLSTNIFLEGMTNPSIYYRVRAVR